MNKLQLKIKCAAVTVSSLLLLISLLTSSYDVQVASAISLILFCLLGIPHGANDFMLFQHLTQDKKKKRLVTFLSLYALMSGVVLLVWYCFPVLALAVFLIISCYHFGQANWSEAEIGSVWKTSMYYSWGAFVLAGSLLWNYSETHPIVSAIIGFEVDIPLFIVQYSPAFFLVCTVFLLFLFYKKGALSRSGFAVELISLIVLCGLFLYTPLLVGFSMFFVFWHSTVSISDQIRAFQQIDSRFSLKDYLYAAAPISLAAFLMLGFFLLSSDYRTLSSQWIGEFFMFISIITIPHALLMDRLLENNAQEDKHPMLNDTIPNQL